MVNIFKIIIILLTYCSICVGQNETLVSDNLYKETRRCISDPEHFQEVIFEYSSGKLSRIINYSNTLLYSYEDIIYNQFGNEEKRITYNYDDDIQTTIVSTYDFKQKLLERKSLNNKEEVKIFYQYDTLSRIVAEKYFNDSYNPDISDYYILYEYTGENLVKKSTYKNSSLRAYELYFYDNNNNKVKTEFYSNDLITSYIVYKYSDNMLTNEYRYNSSNGERFIFEQAYLYNFEKQLIEIIRNGVQMRKNFYENKRLIRSETYESFHGQRANEYCPIRIVEYEYFK